MGSSRMRTPLPPCQPCSARGDRDHRALDRRRRGQRAVDVEIDAEAREHAAGLALLLGPAHAAGRSAGEAAVQGKVVHRVELEHEPEVLMDEAQAAGHAVPERERLAVEFGREPGSGAWKPARVLISVDLPDPFCPTSAWISPGRMSSAAAISARVAPNVFDRPVMRSAGGAGPVPLRRGAWCVAALMWLSPSAKN